MILIPLAKDGHNIKGPDQATNIVDRPLQKIGLLPPALQRNDTLIIIDVGIKYWLQGYNLVVLGGNCFYELATP